MRPEAGHRELLEAIEERHLVYTHDTDGVFRYVSRSVTRLLGYSPEEILQHYDALFTDHPVNDAARRHTELSIQGHRQPPYEVELFHKDGSRRWLEVSETPVVDAHGRVVAVQGIAHDATERKRALAALQQSEEEHRAILSNVDEILYRVQVEDGEVLRGRLDFVGGRAREIVGWSAEDFLGDPGLWMSCLHPDDVPAVASLTREAVAGGRTFTREYRLRHKDSGEYRWLEDRVTPRFDGAGRVVAFFGAARDVTERRRAEEALRRSEARYRSLLTQAAEGIFLVDPATLAFLEANPVFCRMVGLSEEELCRRTLHEVVDAEREVLEINRQTLLLTGSLSIPRGRIRRTDGTVLEAAFWVSLVSAGETRLCVASAVDLSERSRAEAVQSALYRVAERTASIRDLPTLYRSIHEIVGELLYARNFYVALHDPRDGTLSLPYFVDEIDERPATEPLGRGLTAYVIRTGRTLLATPERFRELVESGEVDSVGSASVDWLGAPLKAGDRVFGVLAVQSYREGVRYTAEDAEVLTFVAQHVSAALERKRAEELLEHQTHHDELTLLPNRLAFADRLAEALARAGQRGEGLALMFVDLDRFKAVNDTLGRAAGDRLLQEVAARLASCLREGDTVARLGGDEFMLLLPDLHGAGEAAQLADAVLRALRPPFHLGTHELRLTASLGIALSPEHGEDPETLVRHADLALGRAKERGGDNGQVYDAGMNVRTVERLALETSLRRALERGEFLLHYQPQVGVRGGRLVGVEALVRWRGVDGRLVPPDEFIPLCEETGIIVPLGEWVLREACEQGRRWHRQGLRDMPVAVNISARQFLQQDLVRLVGEVLRDTSLPPSLLELELTETVVMRDAEAAAEVLRELRSRGVRISIDDFGTGYSSLSNLRRFPLQALKIDQSFVGGCTVDPDDAAIVKAILSMARSLKLSVTAEGVETREQLALLRRHGCHAAQGFLFGRAMEAGEVAEMAKGGLAAGGGRRSPSRERPRPHRARATEA